MKCPVCHASDLRQQLLKNGLVVDTCAKCRGVWLDRGELLRFTSNKEFAQLGIDQLAWNSTEVQRQCPHCQHRMLQGAFADSSIEIDYCSQCEGVWFDAFELKRVIQRSATRESSPNDSPVRSCGARKKQKQNGIIPQLVDAVVRTTQGLRGQWTKAVLLSEHPTLDAGFAISCGRVTLTKGELKSPLTNTSCGSYYLSSGFKTINESPPRITELHKSEWRYATCFLHDAEGMVVAEIDLEAADFQLPSVRHERNDFTEGTKSYFDAEDVYVVNGDFLHVIGDFARRYDGIPTFFDGEHKLVVTRDNPIKSIRIARRKGLLLLTVFATLGVCGAVIVLAKLLL